MVDARELSGRLQAHIRDLEAGEAMDFDESLFEECETFLAPQLAENKQESAAIIVSLTRLALDMPDKMVRQQDLRPILSLLIKLVKPLSFKEVYSIQPAEDFVGGLQLEAQPFHMLVLELLGKATGSAQDAATLATNPAILENLVNLWLATGNTAVAQKAQEVLLGLFTVDKRGSKVETGEGGKSLQTSTEGQGLVWRRVFGDKTIYRLLFSLTDVMNANNDTTVSKIQRSIAQGRLLEMIPHLARLDWSYISQSHHPDVETEFGLNPKTETWLDYVTQKMVDTERDVGTHLLLFAFFPQFIREATTPDHSSLLDESTSLRFMKDRNLHAKILSLWLYEWKSPTLDLTLRLAYPHAAEYVAAYAQTYPQAFLASPDAQPVLERLDQSFAAKGKKWHGVDPVLSSDLQVLASLPRIALLRQKGLGFSTSESSALFRLDPRIRTASLFDTLGAIFRGPQNIPGKIMSERDTELAALDAAAARALFIAFFVVHDSLFDDISKQAKDLSNLEGALAAIGFIHNILCSNWESLPIENMYDENQLPRNMHELPSEENLFSMGFCSDNKVWTPSEFQKEWKTGLIALLSAHNRHNVLRTLLEPPKATSHDVQSYAYRVAAAKWDVLKTMHKKLKDDQNAHLVPEYGTAKAMIEDRLSQGLWGATANAHAVATQEF